MKTIADLKQRWWYRAISIIYTIGVTLNFLITTFIVYVSLSGDSLIIIMIFVCIAQTAWFVFILPGIFYYVVLGKFNPPMY